MTRSAVETSVLRLTSGTIASLTNLRAYDDIDYVQGVLSQLTEGWVEAGRLDANATWRDAWNLFIEQHSFLSNSIGSTTKWRRAEISLPLKKLSLVFYTDPGHGWLAVPLATIRSVGAVISQYSYVGAVGGLKMVFCEEDLDANSARQAMTQQGFELDFITNYTERSSFIRALDHYENPRWHEYKAAKKGRLMPV